MISLRKLSANLIPAVAVLALFGVGCVGGSTSPGDAAIVDDLIGLLREENAAYYAFGCVDYDGDVLANGPSLDEIATEVGADSGHDAGVWESEVSGIILGGGNQRSIVIQDPNSEPTNAEDFDQRIVSVEGGSLTCFLPQTEP